MRNTMRVDDDLKPSLVVGFRSAASISDGPAAAAVRGSERLHGTGLCTLVKAAACAVATLAEVQQERGAMTVPWSGPLTTNNTYPRLTVCGYLPLMTRLPLKNATHSWPEVRVS